MLRVGLTGGVGSGKSTAAQMFEAHGARVSQSDEIGRSFMQPGHAVFDAIVECFGPAVVTPSGQLDRALLARAAFEGGRLEELNAIVHPAVIQAQTVWLIGVGISDPLAVAVVESALILETKYGEPGTSQPWRSRFDRLVVVTAPEPLRRERYLARIAEKARDTSVEAATKDFDRRAAAQWTDRQKAAFADHVLRNDGSIDQLRCRVEELYRLLRQESADRAESVM